MIKKIELFKEIKRKYSDNIFIVNTILSENSMRNLKPKYRCENIFILVYIFVTCIYLIKKKVSYLYENNKSTFTFFSFLGFKNKLDLDPRNRADVYFYLFL